MRARSQSGYSLVELLVVLALLGLIAIAISGGMRFGARVWERSESVVASAELARGGHAYLRNLLSRIYPREAGTTGTSEEEAFSGDAGRIRFLADALSSSEPSGVSRFTLSTKRDGAFVSLMLSQAAERGPSVEREDVLLTGAKDIAFAYGRVVDGALVWSDSWHERTDLPALIRVRISFSSARGHWPDLIVRPRIDRAANCIYDPVSFSCRHG